MINKYSDYAALIGRLFLASMFLLFGFGKPTGYFDTVSYMGSLGLPAPALFTCLPPAIETAGGLLILVGYQIQLVSLGLRSTPVSAFIGDRRWFAGVFCFRWRRLFA